MARKLAIHFAADEPAADTVDRLTRAFRDSDGDLREVARALVDLPEAWEDSSRKFRAPQDWLVAVLRAFEAGELPAMVPLFLRQLRHPLWAPPAPNGFPDTTSSWADPDSLLNRAELARTVARRLGGRRIEPRALLDTIEAPEGNPLQALLTDNTIPADERLALAIAGPAFQWR